MAGWGPLNTTAALLALHHRTNGLAATPDTPWEAVGAAAAGTWVATLLWLDAGWQLLTALWVVAHPILTAWVFPFLRLLAAKLAAAAWRLGAAAAHCGAKVWGWGVWLGAAAVDRLAAVDPLVWRQLAVGCLWVAGVYAGYRWMERRGHFAALRRRYQGIAQKAAARTRRVTAAARRVAAAVGERSAAVLGYVEAVGRWLRTAGAFLLHLPGDASRTLRAAGAWVRSTTAQTAQFFWRLVGMIAGLPAWVRGAAAAAAVDAHTSAAGRLEAVHQAVKAKAAEAGHACTLPLRFLVSLPARTIGWLADQRQRLWDWMGGVWDGTRARARETFGRSLALLEPYVERLWPYVKVAQVHTVYWALVGVTLWLVPGSPLRLVQIVFHGPWVVDFAFPVCHSLYALQAPHPDAFQGNLKYWVVYFNLHLLSAITPSVVLRLLGGPFASPEPWLFFVVWLQLPVTDGADGLARGLAYLTAGYVRQPAWAAAPPEGVSAAMRALRFVSRGWITTLLDVAMHSWHLVWYCIFFFTPGFITAYGCLLAGIVLPTTFTLGALAAAPTPEAAAQQRDRQERWLRYWLAFAAVHVLFHRLLLPFFGFVPLLRHLLLFLTIWLQLPYQIGAKMVPVALAFVGHKTYAATLVAYTWLTTEAEVPTSPTTDEPPAAPPGETPQGSEPPGDPPAPANDEPASETPDPAPPLYIAAATTQTAGE